MKLIYSFAKQGAEAEYWTSELSSSSTDKWSVIPFNHGRYISGDECKRAQLLDNHYYDHHSGLLRLYRDLLSILKSEMADVLLVDTYPPYHPDFLRGISTYKVLRINDGPLSAYDRDFAYLHAYDRILYHSPAYSRDLSMPEKLRYCGARKFDLWPLALFDKMFVPPSTEDELFRNARDIDIVFVGAAHLNKMPLIAKVKKAFGSRFRLFGLSSVKRNVYFNLKYGFPGWIRPISIDAYVPLYQRARIGLNVHNRGKYTVGSYRMFDLPGNGVMQISDGGEYLNEFFDVGNEIVGYETVDELIDKLRYYLANDGERERIARNGFRRVMKDHRNAFRMGQLFEILDGALQSKAGRGG